MKKKVFVLSHELCAMLESQQTKCLSHFKHPSSLETFLCCFERYLSVQSELVKDILGLFFN